MEFAVFFLLSWCNIQKNSGLIRTVGLIEESFKPHISVSLSENNSTKNLSQNYHLPYHLRFLVTCDSVTGNVCFLMQKSYILAAKLTKFTKVERT